MKTVYFIPKLHHFSFVLGFGTFSNDEVDLKMNSEKYTIRLYSKTTNSFVIQIVYFHSYSRTQKFYIRK